MFAMPKNERPSEDHESEFEVEDESDTEDFEFEEFAARLARDITREPSPSARAVSFFPRRQLATKAARDTTARVTLSPKQKLEQALRVIENNVHATEKPKWSPPAGPDFIAFLQAKIKAKDYFATLLNPTPEQDVLWVFLVRDPVLYARVCTILGAKKIIGRISRKELLSVDSPDDSDDSDDSEEKGKCRSDPKLCDAGKKLPSKNVTLINLVSDEDEDEDEDDSGDSEDKGSAQNNELEGPQTYEIRNKEEDWLRRIW